MYATGSDGLAVPPKREGTPWGNASRAQGVPSGYIPGRGLPRWNHSRWVKGFGGQGPRRGVPERGSTTGEMTSRRKFFRSSAEIGESCHRQREEGRARLASVRAVPSAPRRREKRPPRNRWAPDRAQNHADPTVCFESS